MAFGLPIYAVFFEPRVVDWPLGGHGVAIVILFALLALFSCLWPVTAPRLAQRVRLTPLVALSALLILPPALATVPMILAALMSIVVNEEATVRRQTLSHFVLIVLAQLITGAALIKTHVLPVTFGMPPLQSFLASFDGFVLFGGLYLGGLHLQRHQEAGRRRNPLDDHGWQVAWTNEATVYLAGAPFAALLSFGLLRDGGLPGAMITIAAASAFGLSTKFMIERKMLRRQVKAVERLTECATIGKKPNPIRLVEELLERSHTLVLFDKARVWVFNEDDTLLQCVGEYPIKKTTTSVGDVRRMGEELIGRVAERKSAMILADVRKDARHASYWFTPRQKAHLGPVSQMIVPLVANGDTMGVIEFERRQWNAFSIADRDRIQCLASLVAMGLANIRRHQDVIQLAVTDGLTGLYNKRHITNILQDEINRSERYGHTLSVIMMDLDSFKHYNDTYGHLQGDALLSQLAAIIQDSIRSSDHAGRYGGEEFIVIMPETGKDAAHMTAERIRQRIEETQFPGRPRGPETLPESLSEIFPEGDDTWVQKTISIGLANYPHDAQDARSLVGLADDALYQAKRTGRNRVIAAGEFERAAV